MEIAFINLEYHPNDSRLKIAECDTCQSLTQRMGTGGNNVPLILQVIFDDNEEKLHEDTDNAERSGRRHHELEL